MSQVAVKNNSYDERALNLLLMRQYNTMQNGGNPRRFAGNNDYKDDFNNFYNARDNISSSSGTGVQSDAQSMQELHFLSEKRLGVGYHITEGVSEDSLFNWWQPKKVDTLNTRVNIPGLNKWIVDSDFKNQAIIWNTHRRRYGIGLLCKFWTANDQMELPAPNKPPKAFQVISPLYMGILNTYQTRYIDYDEELWKFQGGNIRPRAIHRSRIEVIRGTPQQDTYRGLSVLEPIYLPLICYYNAIIYITRGLSKWGNMVPVLKSGSVIPTPEEYTKFLTLMEQFVMNGFFFLGKDDDMQYPNTNIGQGLFQTLEIMKEEIASGTRIPMNKLFGRAESGGIGGEGALTAERTYLNLLANEQTKISDDIIRIIKSAGFDFEGLELDWNLALQKTREQELMEERMELENKALKLNNSMQSQEIKMLKMQQEMFDKYKDEGAFNPDQALQHQERIKEDFVHTKDRNTQFQKYMQMISLKGRK
jgi:hypothetical protein